MKFTEDHEWLRIDHGIVVVGITRHAAEQLGDIVFVDLPKTGTQVAKGDDVGLIESSKAASDIFAPLSGAIIAVNTALKANPGLVNHDPLHEAWFFKMKADDLTQMDGYLDEVAYLSLVG